MKNSIMYHNGIYKTESETLISFRDLGFQRAYGVFDFMRTYNRRPFQATWHSQKLMHSLSEMNIITDFDDKKFLQVVKELFVRNQNQLRTDTEYGIKTIITGGTNGNPTVLMYLEELDETPYIQKRKNGIGLLAKRAPRQSPDSKNIDYKALFSSQRELNEKNCLEILHRGDTYLYESGTSNIFIVKDNKIITPSDNIYRGSTRNFVINLANTNSMIVEERFVTWDECIDADEVFITASKKEILPVSKIYDKESVHQFAIGPITQQLIALFNIHKFDEKYFEF